MHNLFDRVVCLVTPELESQFVWTDKPAAVWPSLKWRWSWNWTTISLVFAFVLVNNFFKSNKIYISFRFRKVGEFSIVGALFKHALRWIVARWSWKNNFCLYSYFQFFTVCRENYARCFDKTLKKAWLTHTDQKAGAYNFLLILKRVFFSIYISVNI